MRTLPEQDYSPLTKMVLGPLAAILGPAIVFSLKLWSMGVQAGALPW